VLFEAAVREPVRTTIAGDNTTCRALKAFSYLPCPLALGAYRPSPNGRDAQKIYVA